jgi:phage shock protein A
MGFWGRFRRAMGAQLHDVLTRAEDPVKMVNYQVRQMQESAEAAREEVAKAIAAERRLAMQEVEARRAAVGWETRARWAVTHGDDALAREALHRKGLVEELADYYQRAHAQQAQAVAELRATLDRLARMLVQAKARRSALLAHHDAARAQQTAARTITRLHGGDTAEAFDRLAEQIVSDGAHAQGLLALSNEDSEARFAALEASEVVEDELRALKETLGIEHHPALPEARDDGTEAA